jgi:hypothetical protein
MDHATRRETLGGNMGLFWDLIQQNQIDSHARHASSLEERVSQLEVSLNETRSLLQVMLERLEKSLGEDIDKDGRVG